MNKEQIKAVRIHNRMTQEEFSDLLGIPKGTYSNIELGNVPLYKDLAAKIEHAFRELDCDFNVLHDEAVMKSLPQKVYHPGSKKPYTKQRPAIKLGVSSVTVEKAETVHKHDLFRSIASEVAETLVRKNTDYGDSFHDVYKEFGDMSTYIRLNDKMGRLKSLIFGKDMKVKDEPIEDVLKDIAGYCILTLSSKERLKQREEE